MIAEVEVSLGERSYPIFIGTRLLPADLCSKYVKGQQALIVTNEVVGTHYLATLTNALQAVEWLADVAIWQMDSQC